MNQVGLESVRSVAQDALTGAGFKVLLAENGRRALEMLREHRGEIGAVLLDLTMPVMGGERALEEIRRTDAELPVILSSGYTEEEATSRLTHGEFTAFLRKPYSIWRLAEMVADLVAD